MVSVIEVSCMLSFGNVPEDGHNQGWLDRIIREEINFIDSHLNDPKYGNIFYDIKNSVLWTDTERETTSPVPPVAFVVMNENTYCGHIYIWLQQNGDLLEAHVIGIRKSAKLIYENSEIKVMPILFDACEKWALLKGAKALRAQDPLTRVAEYLESKGYGKTFRWQDLLFKYKDPKIYEKDLEKSKENPDDYYTDYIKYF